MSQIVGNGLHIHTVLQGQGRISMAQVMEAYFGKPHLCNDGFEMVVDRHAGQMLSKWIGEDQVQIIVVCFAVLQLSFRLPQLLLFQDADHAGRCNKVSGLFVFQCGERPGVLSPFDRFQLSI